MVRPNTLHKGFFIPNAGDVVEPHMAEPDRIDFNIGGNSRWGVAWGCEVTISSGTDATATAGVAIVQGKPVQLVTGDVLPLEGGGSQPRFDLVCVNAGGKLVRVKGDASTNPVFPDPPLSNTVLAAVYVPVGAAMLTDYVIDKRNMLAPVLMGTGTGDEYLIANRTNGVGSDTFRINANGKMLWNNGEVVLSKTATGVLTLNGKLIVSGLLTASGGITASGALTTTDYVTGKNIVRSGSFPASEDGTFLVNNGTGYLRKDGTWNEILTTQPGGPTFSPGDIKQSMRNPTEMPGWVPLNGQTILEADAPDLFTLAQFGQIGAITGTSPNRVMVLPDARNRVLISDGGDVPPAGTLGGADDITLTTENMPIHKHGVTLTEAPNHAHGASSVANGKHTHQFVTTNSSTDGTHNHDVGDSGHVHHEAQGPGQSSRFVAIAWDVHAKMWIDGGADGTLDQTHIAVVDAQDTNRAYTDIAVGYQGSAHIHALHDAADHAHTITVADSGKHNHTVTENSVGSAKPFKVRPRYLVVYTYIKL